MRLRYYDYHQEPVRPADKHIGEMIAAHQNDEDALRYARQLIIEKMYRIDHCTYCKVSPDMTVQLCEAQICVPVEHIKMPVHAFAVRLAEPLQWECSNGERYDVGSMLVSTPDAMNIESEDGSTHKTVCLLPCPPVYDPEFFSPYYILPLPPDLSTLKESDIAGVAGLNTTNALRFFRLALGALLIMNGAAPTLLDRDCLAKDEDRYAKATPKRKRELAERAERRTRRKGYYIGREQSLPRASHGAEPPNEGQGRALQYRHYRCGHFHTVCFGRSHSERRVQWFPPTVVKPDLPAAPEYRKRYAIGK